MKRLAAKTRRWRAEGRSCELCPMLAAAVSGDEMKRLAGRVPLFDHPGSAFHHRRLRSQGGCDCDENLLWTCMDGHRWAHDHPRIARKAKVILYTGDEDGCRRCRDGGCEAAGETVGGGGGDGP